MRQDQHRNCNVQNAFSEHGYPEFQVLEMCDAACLDDKEAEHLTAVFGNELCLNIFKRTPEHVRAFGKAGDRKSYKAALRALPEYQASFKAHRSSREYKEAQLAYGREYRKTAKGRAIRRASDEKRRATPEYKAQKREYDRKRYEAQKMVEPLRLAA